MCLARARPRCARPGLWLAFAKIEWEKPVLKGILSVRGTRDVISLSLSLICSTYFANSSSFAFFASSAASTGGRVGEKGTGLFGPFFFRARRRFGDFFSSTAGAGAGAVVSFGPPFTAGVVFVRRRTGAGAAAAPPAAFRGRLRLLFEPLRTSLTEGDEIGLSGGAGAHSSRPQSADPGTRFYIGRGPTAIVSAPVPLPGEEDAKRLQGKPLPDMRF